jgi:hypothetical protein
MLLKLRKILLLLWLTCIIVTVVNTAQADDFGSWRLKVNPGMVLGIVDIVSVFSEEPPRLWVEAVEKSELGVRALNGLSQGLGDIYRYYLSSTGSVTYIYDGDIMHDDACEFIDIDASGAYSYVLQDAC